MTTINSLKGDCACGRHHDTTVRDVRIGPGLVNEVGSILRENDFTNKLLVVADKNTLSAASGIEQSLEGFDVTYKIYDELRVADLVHVEELEELIRDKEISVLSVGTGSLNDPCRLACARQNKLFAIFATAPSMDGFASYSSPLVSNGFKSSYAAKSPEVIIGDTAILAASPVYLKSAGFGDMIAKYVALIDWQVTHLLTGEYYCEKVAKLTRDALDSLVELADKVTQNDEETAGKIFESLLMTGIGMSFTQNSRPASGSEHVVAHLIECKELPQGIVPNYHGEDVGVCTLEVLKLYESLTAHEHIKAHADATDWDSVYDYYGPLAESVRGFNEPKTVTDEVDPSVLEASWGRIREIVASVPSYAECKEAMIKAGCKLTREDIGKSEQLFDDCMKYSPYMRYRLTLLRLLPMIDLV